MKSQDRKKSNKTETLWDAFVSYLESVYFQGAAELLDRKLLAFEFENFKETYS